MIKQLEHDDCLWWGALALCKQMYEESGYHNVTYSEARVGRTLDYCIKSGFARIVTEQHKFVGIMAGEITHYSFSDDKLAQDIVLYVIPEYRNQGIAKALVEDFVYWASVRGAREVLVGLSHTNSEKINEAERTRRK